MCPSLCIDFNLSKFLSYICVTGFVKAFHVRKPWTDSSVQLITLKTIVDAYEKQR